MESLGQRIGRLRGGMGLTQDALARRVGVTGQAISNYEHDNGGIPKWTTLAALAREFGMTLAEFTEDVAMPAPKPKSKGEAA